MVERNSGSMLNALTIDVEDYFQVTAFERHVRRDEWHHYPLRVESNTCQILDILEEYKVSATFFVLGWVAERLPILVRRIRDSGHEIASHGYGHELIYRIGPEKFRADVRKAKIILEDITGEKVCGYRAPSYSITRQSLWAFDILADEGYTYDSSTFPVLHDIYGIPGGERFPHEVRTEAGTIREFPISTFPLKVGKWQSCVPIAGGGYLRLLPASLVGHAINYINAREMQPAVVYFHPWEIDPGQPRVKAGLKSRFRHYLNLELMEAKIKYLLSTHRFTAIRDIHGFGPP